MPHAFQYRYVSTVNDLLDAFAADLEARTGMRSSIRLCLALVGVMFVAGAFWATIAGDAGWRAIAWLGMGSIILWKLIVQPAVRRTEIRRNNVDEQPLDLQFTDVGIKIKASAVGDFERLWSELALVTLAKRGVLVGFTDGVMNWIPNRAFADKLEKRRLVDYLQEQQARQLETEQVHE